MQETQRRGFDPWVGKIPWRRKWQPSPVFLYGKSHGQRILAGYSPRDHKESDTTEQVNCTDNTAWKCKGKKAMCVLVAQSCPTLCIPIDCAHQASLSISNSWSFLKFMSIEWQWHQAISSSTIPFSSCLQSFLS